MSRDWENPSLLHCGQSGDWHGPAGRSERRGATEPHSFQALANSTLDTHPNGHGGNGQRWPGRACCWLKPILGHRATGRLQVYSNVGSGLDGWPRISKQKEDGRWIISNGEKITD